MKKSKNDITRNIFIVYSELHNLNKNVTIAWILSRKGITGNELADLNAKEDIDSTTKWVTNPYPYEELIH